MSTESGHGEVKFRTGPGATVTITSLEEAFTAHQAAGLIRSWRRTEHPLASRGRGTRARPLWVITLADRGELSLTTPWEAHAFLSGLASARASRERA